MSSDLRKSFDNLDIKLKNKMKNAAFNMSELFIPQNKGKIIQSNTIIEVGLVNKINYNQDPDKCHL